MSSSIERVKGGGFGKENRFPGQIHALSPGPNYTLPSCFSGKKSQHIQGHVYKPSSDIARKPRRLDLPHPNKDRTAWMIGTVKGGMAYYDDVPGHGGPANYKQDVSPIKPHSPSNAFCKEQRFGHGSMTKQFISHEHNATNLCTASQGPKYLPGKHAIDFNGPTPPKYSFGSKGVSDRSMFVNKTVRNGYLYDAKPATSGKMTSVDAATYSPNYKATKNASPSGQFSKADRFASQNKTFISNKHSREKVGLNSPGPVYNPHNYDLSRSKKMATATAAGKWCP